MKLFLFGLGLLAQASLSFASVKQDRLPTEMNCLAIRCLEGNPDFCSVEEFVPVEITDIRSARGPLWNGGRGVVVDAPSDRSKTHLDFGVAAQGGDQYLFLSFDKRDLRDLALGRVQRIRGIYEDGYDWVNGYNVRARLEIGCTK